MKKKKMEDRLAEKTRPPWKTLLGFGFGNQKKWLEDNQSMVVLSSGSLMAYPQPYKISGKSTAFFIYFCHGLIFRQYI